VEAIIKRPASFGVISMSDERSARHGDDTHA
jgi:hypothetical protein